MSKINPKLRPDCPYHITARTNNSDWFNLPMPTVWEIFERQLFFIRHGFEVQIHSFVLMDNHFHMLISDPEMNISKAMRWLMTETSREINQLSGQRNHIYGQKHYRSRIDSYHYFLAAYKYVYRNPVEAGICTQVESYPFSTLHGLLGMAPLRIPIYSDLLLNEDLENTLRWLNYRVHPEDKKIIQRALSKPVFELGIERGNRKPHRLESEMY